MVYEALYESKIGLLRIKANEEGILSIEFIDKIDEKDFNDIDDSHFLKQCIKELDEYFSGERKNFDVNIVLEGTEFRKKVWKELMNIPYGETCSYKDIAIKIGNPKACRAVGGANNKNKIPIIIPCHRVVGASGKLVGYAGGLERKEVLLDNERKGLCE